PMKKGVPPFMLTWLGSRNRNVSFPGVPEIVAGTVRSSSNCTRGRKLRCIRFFADMLSLQAGIGLRYNGDDIGFGGQTLRRVDAGPVRTDWQLGPHWPISSLSRCQFAQRVHRSIDTLNRSWKRPTASDWGSSSLAASNTRCSRFTTKAPRADGPRGLSSRN